MVRPPGMVKRGSSELAAVGIRQEAHIENQIGIAGYTVAIAKADDGNEHGTLVGILEALGDKVAQLVHVELRSVYDHIGEFADRLHHRAFLAQAFADGNIFSERVRAPRLAVAS